jgi:hypothetical protein
VVAEEVSYLRIILTVWDRGVYSTLAVRPREWTAFGGVRATVKKGDRSGQSLVLDGEGVRVYRAKMLSEADRERISAAATGAA